MGDRGREFRRGCDDARPSRRLWPMAALALIVAAGVFLRVYRLDRESAFLDEVYTIEHCDAPDVRSFFEVYRMGDPFTPPVYLTIDYFWTNLVHGSVAGVRMLSILFGVLCLPLMYVLARDLCGKRAGPISAAILAASLYHVYFSQEIRVYSLVLALSLLSTLSLVRLLHTNAPRWWLLHLAVNLTLPLVHLMAALLVFAQGCFLLMVRWRRPRLVAVWMIGNALAMIPVMVWIGSLDFAVAFEKTAWMSTPPLENLVVLLCWGTGSATIGSGATWWDWAMGAALVAVAMAAAVGEGARAVSGWRRSYATADDRGLKPWETYVLLLAWMIIPPATLIILSYVWKPCFIERYVIYTMLPVAILIGAGIGHIRARRAQVAAVALLVLLYGYQLRFLAHPLRSDWQRAAQVVQAEGTPDDLIFVVPQWQRDSLRFYSRLPGYQIFGLNTLDGVLARGAVAFTRGQGCWAVLWSGDAPIGQFETALSALQVPFTRRTIPSMAPLHVYHLQRAPGAG